MNRQRIFNRVVRHLLRQRAKSRSSVYHCKYYTEKDNQVLKCAVGCLIPKNLYDPKIEGEAASDLPKKILDHIGVKNAQDKNFLNDLQGIHDSHEVEDWLSQFWILAREYDLKDTALKEFE